MSKTYLVKFKEQDKETWRVELFLTGGMLFGFRDGMKTIKKLRKMARSLQYKLVKVLVYPQDSAEITKGLRGF